jgi:hypothetical protein
MKRKRSRGFEGLAVVFAFTLASSAAAQVPVTPQQADVLQRPVELLGLDGTGSDAVTGFLVQAQVPGGIILIYDECAQPRLEHFSFPRGTLQQGLDYISTTEVSWRWTYKDGVVLAAHGDADKTILNTVIRAVDISSRDALSFAAQKLFLTPEVQAAVSKAGLEEMVPPIGFSAMQPSGKHSQQESTASQQKHLQNITLEKALNSLAEMHGSAVWRYEQFKCGAKSSYRVGWAGS